MPTTAKKRAVMIPCENICIPAPNKPSGLRVAKPINTNPIWDTEEKPMTYLKSV